MFSKDKFKIKDSNIATIDLSDHSPISITLDLKRKTKKTIRQLNSNILNDPKIMETLKKDISDYLELNDSGEVTPTILWDTLKAVVRGKLISITTRLKKMKGQMLTDLQGKLKQLLLADSRKEDPSLRREI